MRHQDQEFGPGSGFWSVRSVRRSRRLRQLRKMRVCALWTTARRRNVRFPTALQKSGVKPTAEVDTCLWAARRIQRQLFSDAVIRLRLAKFWSMAPTNWREVNASPPRSGSARADRRQYLPERRGTAARGV